MAGASGNSLKALRTTDSKRGELGVWARILSEREVGNG